LNLDRFGRSSGSLGVGSSASETDFTTEEPRGPQSATEKEDRGSRGAFAKAGPRNKFFPVPIVVSCLVTRNGPRDGSSRPVPPRSVALCELRFSSVVKSYLSRMAMTENAGIRSRVAAPAAGERRSVRRRGSGGLIELPAPPRYIAIAYAGRRGSAPAPISPVFGSVRIASTEPASQVQSGQSWISWPRAASSSFVA